MSKTDFKSILDKFCKVYGFKYCLDHFPYSGDSPFSMLKKTNKSSKKPGGTRLILERDFVGMHGVRTRHPTRTKRGSKGEFADEDFFATQGPSEEIAFKKAVELLLDTDKILFYVNDLERRSIRLSFDTLESLEIWLDLHEESNEKE